MLHPVALVALVALIVNDHVLKGRGWGIVTGKVSDVAGLVFFPLLLVSMWEFAQRLRGASWQANRVGVVVAIAVTAVGFAAVKVDPAMAHAYSSLIGLRVRADATDLLALPALVGAWWVATERYVANDRPHTRPGQVGLS